MSKYSGKCDLFDYMSGLGGWFDKDGSPAALGEGPGPYYSDEWLDFLAFKKATGGVLHQHKKVALTAWNAEAIKKRCSGFDYKKIVTEVEDKRYKDGIRKDVSYTYIYYGKEYTLKELNKKGIYITLDIHFDTLLDLIPYYPYIVSAAAHSPEKTIIYISDLPYPIEERNDSFKNGVILDHRFQYYAKELQDHYKDIVLKYYNPACKEVIETLKFNLADDKYIAETSYEVDDQFPVEWIFDDEKFLHWKSPELLSNHEIVMCKQDAEKFLGTTMKVKYVKYVPHEIDLH